jgi:hypothetical protein
VGYLFVMMTRHRDSILDLRVSGGGAAMMAALAFLLGYGMRGSDGPLDRSSAAVPAETGLVNTLVWGAMMTVAWASRDRLRELMMGSMMGAPHARLPLLALAFVPVMAADLFTAQITAALCPDPGCPNQFLSIPPLYTFLPRAAILGTTVLLVLLAWERHLAGRAPRQAYAVHVPIEPAAPPINGEWLDFPEAPLLRIRADDVVLIRSAGNYSEIVAQGRAHLVRATLSDLAERLAPMGFVRVHRQTIINMRNVREICRDTAGRALIHLACGNSVTVGRRYMTAIDSLTR